MDEEVVRQELLSQQVKLWADFDAPQPLELLHFTNPQAFVGIITNHELWCTDFAQVNDPDEGLYGIKIVRKLAFRKSVPSWLRDLLCRDDLGGLKEDWTVYVSCFCSGGQHDHMWFNYASSGRGYAIGFDYEKLSEDGRGRYALHRMLYDAKEQERIACGTLDHAIHYGRRLGLSKSDTKDYWIGRVAHALISCTSRFKDPRWCAEQEYRLADWKGNDPFEVEGRRRTKVTFPTSAVTKIIRGTASDDKLSAEKIKKLLIESGYSDDIEILNYCADRS